MIPADTTTRPRDVYPASPLQQGMLFHAQQSPGAGIDMLHLDITLEHPVDAAALREAWRRVAARHDILRTSFRWEDEDRPMQRVHPLARVPFREVDWRGRTPAKHPAALERYMARDRARGFDLSRAPGFRLLLIRETDARSRLLWTVHHVLLDVRGMVLVLEEVFAAYEALTAGREPGLPPLPPYREYIDWVEAQDFEQAEAFWRGALAGYERTGRLVGTVPGAPAVSRGGEFIHLARNLSPEVTTGLHRAAAACGVTLNTVLQGAWAVVLARRGSGADVLLGATRDCRRSTVAGGRGTVGLLVNTVPLRVRVDDSEPFPALLAALRAQSLALRAHEHTPLAQVQRWSGAPAGEPLLETVLNFNYHSLHETLRARGGTWLQRGVRLVAKTSFPLTVNAYGDDALSMVFEFSTDQLEPAAVERMAEHFAFVLAEVAADPMRPVGTLSGLTPEERRTVVHAWNDTARPYPAGETVADLFAWAAARHANAVAVEYGVARLTYADLDARANRLARRLVRLGAVPDARVGICLERSTELVVALLAVLKSGACYVPLDPHYPQDRLAYTLEDSGAALLLTQSSLADRFGASAARVVRLDDAAERSAVAEESAAPIRSAAGPEHLGYVIYTSGSTGRPKGVALPQGALVNLLRWQGERTGDRPVRTLQFTSLSFDVSFQEIFSTWCAGGTLVGVAEEVRRDPEALLAWLVDRRVERIFLPFVALQHVAEASNRLGMDVPDLREVITAGEALQSTPSLLRFFERHPRCVLENQYGPSETHVVSAHALRDAPAAWPLLPPIGRPIANMGLYVLDGRMRLVPPGVSGELYLGGAGLARGYLARRALTAERFVPDSVSGTPGARLYRTGDLVRMREDGEAEFLGRADSQVKVRGYRIEPGEVEAALRRHPGVREAVVVAREDAPGDRILAAYLVSGDADAPDPAQLRGWLRERLPEYMVPAAFSVIERLPLTPSGKVDRNALPAPRRVEAAVGAVPRTQTEQLLAGIWSEVLGVSRVGAMDDFFDLGGHSLRVSQVTNRIRRVFSVRLPGQVLFAERTLERVAVRIDAARGAERATGPALTARPSSAHVPASFAQEALWMANRLAPGPVYNLPAAVHLAGPLDARALGAALTEVFRRHEALRTTLAERDGAPVQVVQGASDIPLSVELVDGAELDGILAEEAVRPFDLERGPLFRARLLRTGADAHVLLLCMHHVASDGWSMGVLFREVGALYAAFRSSAPSPLPPLPLQYADYALWQRETLTNETLAPELAWWRERLADASPALELPTDRVRPARRSHAGAVHRLLLPADLTEGLRALGRREGATLHMVLLAAFHTLLARYAGADDVVVGTPTAGRTREELEPLVGCFVNPAPVRAQLGDDPSFAALLARVREAVLQADARQEVPFEKLVEALGGSRSAAHAPVFQVLFTLLDAGVRALTLEGLQARVEWLSTGTARVDLVMVLEEETGGGVSGLLEYSTELFESATAERLARHYLRLLRAVAEDAGRPVSELRLMEDDEARALGAACRQADPHPATQSIVPLLEAQVRATPERTALAFGGEETSYGELNARANRLARHLRAMGTGPESRVGVALERSAEFVVAIVAVLKAGGVYVPIDPSYPAERRGFMLSDAAVSALIVDGEDDQPAAGEAPFIHLSRDAACIDRYPADDLGIEAHPDQLAYVIYTSGSTGTPKGVAVPQRSVVRLVRESDYVRLGAADRIAHLSNTSFDAATFEVWGALLNGGALVGFTRDEGLVPERLADSLRGRGVTALFITTALFNQVARSIPSAFSAVDTVMFGGEASDPESVRRVLAAGPPRRLIHIYGPTETTTFAAWNPVQYVPDGALTVPIGGPIAGARTYVLDRHLALVPDGVPGELYVAGGGVARGYLGRPAMTAERFVPDPFHSGARMYRTGDRVRRGAAGALEFLGRADFQAKIRGFRIEPGEIEAALLALPPVREAVVLVREDSPGERRLVAYAVAAEGTDESASTLRDALRARLPEYMLPSAVVLLPSLPLNPNGKVDRTALPAPAAEGSGEAAAPRTPVEEALRAVWAELLGAESIGRDDDFFALGGHSLLAAQVISRIRERLGVELPLVTLFESPTVAALAAQVESARAAGQTRRGPIARAARPTSAASNAETR